MFYFILLNLLFSFTAFSQIDPNANPATKELYRFLRDTSLSFRTEQKIILGHQNAFVEGRGWRMSNNDVGTPLRTEMFDVAGIHPMLFGIDFLEIHNGNRDFILEKIREVYARKGIITASWHLQTLINDGSGNNGYSDVTAKVVTHILPGGKAHSTFTKKLDELVAFFLEIKDIPVIFRPWHEHNFSWFWWGQDHCTRSEYIALWKYTVDYFQSKGVHNLLYAYSPGHINVTYFERYPGNDYVDILGTDFYFKDPRQDEYNLGGDPLGQWKRNVLWLMGESHLRDKIPALTEFGQEAVWYQNFWTQYIGEVLEKDMIERLTGSEYLPKRGIAYVMFWRNDRDNATHYFGPAVGNKNNQDFLQLLKKGIYLGLEQ